ncbi:uncharacterized protein LOC117649689 isoform X2 [Thrips palmi]|uniref:Uncharacterized protein LOC117649689 isoform X2 n=1 Tax=Thrips palmi TaxID=161013 RepID=A0A6P8ZTH2_THRPL|nr:uncharacterized protein LOC117649689 isoform X2 [Thrips palmi]
MTTSSQLQDDQQDEGITPAATDVPIRIHYPPAGRESLPDEIRDLIVDDSFTAPGDSGVPQDVKPDWFDEKLFLEGQRYARQNFVGVSVAALMGIFLEYSFADGMDPLISTSKSDTPETAGRRYLDTVYKLLTWYSSDPFDPQSRAYKSILGVRRAHARVRKDLADISPEERDAKFTIGKGQPVDLLCSNTHLIKQSFRSISSGTLSCPVVSKVGPVKGEVSWEWDRVRRAYLSQGEMMVTQWALLAPFILRPELFAAPYVTARELEAFSHVWAVFGYCLGIEDRFNCALGDLETVQKRAELILRLVIVPHLRTMDVKSVTHWEHMMTCITEGLTEHIPTPSFRASLAYVTEDLLGQKTNLSKTLAWSDTLQLWAMRLVLRYLPLCATSYSTTLSRAATLLVRRSRTRAFTWWSVDSEIRVALDPKGSS